MIDPTYQKALTEYTSQLRGLFTPAPGATTAPARRGGAKVDAETLAERAQQLVDTSQVLGQQHNAYLAADQPEVVLSAELKLLAQANAEIQVASALLQSAEDELRGKKASARRSGSATARALDELVVVLETPLELGLEPFLTQKVHRGKKSTSPEKARQALKDQVRRSLNSISKNSASASSRALDTLLSLDSEQLKKGISVISKEVAEQFEKIAANLSVMVGKLLKSALRLILQAYEWVMSLIGKDIEQSARKKAKEWCDELRQEHKKEDDIPGLAMKLVVDLFATEQIMTEVNGWVDQSKKKAHELDQVLNHVHKLSEGYKLKTKRVEETLTAISTVRNFARTGAIKFVPLATALPYIELLMVAISLSMMGYILFSGYDHVDSGAVSFMKRFSIKIPDRVKGVRETVKIGLTLPA